MYRLTAIVENLMTGEARQLRWQLDPSTYDAAAHGQTLTEIQAAVADLLAKATTTEPRKIG